MRRILAFLPSKSKKKENDSLRKGKTINFDTKGEYYDLYELYHQINTQYFEGKLKLDITWTGDRNSKPRTRVMFGSYHHQKKLIKIHRRLDQSHIPHFFISFVVYHEMLHHVLPPLSRRTEKYRIHHSSFIEKEREFQDYALVVDFRKRMKSTWFAGKGE